MWHRKATLHPRPDCSRVGVPPLAKGCVTVLSLQSLSWRWDCCGHHRLLLGGRVVEVVLIHTPDLSDITRRQVSHFTSADVGALGDVFGEVCGDFVSEV